MGEIPEELLDGFEDLRSGTEERFEDSNYGWSYGTNYSGKVKTYKFSEENENSYAIASSINTGNQAKTNSNFTFRTAENGLQKNTESRLLPPMLWSR